MNIQKYNEKISLIGIILRRFKVKETIHSSMDILHTIIADGICLDKIDTKIILDYCSKISKSELLITSLSQIDIKIKKDYYLLTCCRCKETYPESGFRLIQKGKRKRRNYSCIFCDRKSWSKSAKKRMENPNFIEYQKQYKAKWIKEKRKSDPKFRENHNLYNREWAKNKRKADELYKERKSL